MPGSSEDYRKMLDERHVQIRDDIAEVKHLVNSSAKGINMRLDRMDHRLDRHDDQIRDLQVGHGQVGRLVPGRETVRANDEELSIRATPRFWATIAAGGAAVYAVVRMVMDQIISRLP